MIADKDVLKQPTLIFFANCLPIFSQLGLSLPSLLSLAVPLYQLPYAFVEVLFLFTVNCSSHLVSFVVIEKNFFEV